MCISALARFLGWASIDSLPNVDPTMHELLDVAMLPYYSALQAVVHHYITEAKVAKQLA